MDDPPIPATLRSLKQAAAHLEDAWRTIETAEPASATLIERLLRELLAEIKRLEFLHPSQG
jgi:hypothetical protein